MRDLDATDIRRTTPGMARLLLIASLLVFLIGVPLVLLPESTADLFAWTIRAPITAVFLGSAYWASGLAELRSSRERVWEYARLTVPPVFVFTTLMLIVTLINRDAFHFGPEQPPAARAVAWIWLVVYAIVPILLAWQWTRQLRAPGSDPPRRAPMVWWARGSLVIHAAIALPLGVALLLAPAQSSPLWPWPLTVLTAQAVGAWLIGIGLGAALGAWENDWRRLLAASPTYIAFGALGLLAMVRYSGAVLWTSLSAWVLVAVLLSMFLGGIHAWRQGRRARGG